MHQAWHKEGFHVGLKTQRRKYAITKQLAFCLNRANGSRYLSSEPSQITRRERERERERDRVDLHVVFI